VNRARASSAPSSRSINSKPREWSHARRSIAVRPFGPVAQAPFINAVVGVLTRAEPLDLLRALRALEVQLGRSPPRQRWGPREIDLDLLLHGDARLDTAELTLPHPGIPERDFVLYPLRDIAPPLQIAGLGRVTELAARVPDRGIERLD